MSQVFCANIPVPSAFNSKLGLIHLYARLCCVIRSLMSSYSIWCLIMLKQAFPVSLNNCKEWLCCVTSGDDSDVMTRYVTPRISVVTQTYILCLHQCCFLFSAKRSCDPKGYLEWRWVWALPEYSGQTGKLLLIGVCQQVLLFSWTAFIILG